MENFKFKNQGYFFFIHNFLPHAPFVFNSDCVLKKGFEKISREKEEEILQSAAKDKNKTLEGYKEQYECMLKRVDEFVNFINKYDPDASVIITADHGNNVKNFYYLGYETFTLIKVEKKCQKDISDNLNTANGVRLILGCTVGKKINFLEKKIYHVDFERGLFTIGGRLSLKRLDPDNYSSFLKNLSDTN